MSPLQEHWFSPLRGWVLRCERCNYIFPDAYTIDLANENHFTEMHPDMDQPHFTIQWHGPGPEPKKRPEYPR